MKRYAFFTLIISLMFFGCSKDEDSGDRIQGLIHFQLNGEDVKYDFGVNGNDPPSEDIVHFVTVWGEGEPGQNGVRPNISFQLIHEHIQEGVTYTSADTEMLYSELTIPTSGGLREFSATNKGGSFKITVTELGHYGVKGTFSGTLTTGSYAPPFASITITNGRFEAPYNYR